MYVFRVIIHIVKKIIIKKVRNNFIQKIFNSTCEMLVYLQEIITSLS